jgi:hypothetical protein
MAGLMLDELDRHRYADGKISSMFARVSMASAGSKGCL